jgi:hypothetical protein
MIFFCVCVCVQCKAEHAAQSVKNAAGGAAADATGAAANTTGAAAGSAQQQEHRAAGTFQQAAEQGAQMGQGAVAAVKDAVTGGH